MRIACKFTRHVPVLLSIEPLGLYFPGIEAMARSPVFVMWPFLVILAQVCHQNRRPINCSRVAGASLVSVFVQFPDNLA